MALGVVTTIAIARTLGPEGRGWVATATTLAGMGTIFGSLGLPQTNSYYGAKNPELRGKLLGNSLLVIVVLTMFLGLVFYAGTVLFPDSIRLPGVFLPLTVLYAGLQLATTLVQYLMISMDLVRPYNYQEITLRALTLGSIAILAWGGWRTAGKYFAVSTMAFVPVVVWAIWLCRRHIPERIEISWPLFRTSASYSSRLYLIAVFYNIFMGLDILLTQKYLGIEQAGIFSIAASMRQILLVLTLVVQTLLLPRLAKLGTYDQRLRMTYKFAILTGLTAVAVCTATYFLADWLVLWLFGKEFLPCVQALNYMLPGLVLYSSGGVLAVILQASGQPWLSVLPMALTLIAHYLFCGLWIPQHGLVGGSLSYSATCGLYLALTWLAVLYYRQRYPA